MYCQPQSQAQAAEPLNVAKIKSDFPIFVSHPDLIYFDNASTTQKPRSVLETMSTYYEKQCANAGRAAYTWSSQLEKAMEESRRQVASFLKTEATHLAFTAGATDSLNLVCQSYALHNLEDGDEVLLCPKDHSSAVLPWYQVREILKAMGKNIVIKHFDIHEVGDYDLKSIKTQLTPKTKILAMSHVHHVYGLEMEVAEIREIVGPEVIISLDASQSVGHTAVDLSSQGLPVDFVSFSAHKMLSAPGTGVLYVSKRVQDKLKPVRLGGKSKAEIVEGELSQTHTTVAELLEAGTQNIPSILALAEAVRYIESIGVERIEAHVSRLTVDLWQKLAKLPGIEFAPGIGICGCDRGWGIISFRFRQISSMDLSFALDEERIFVRSGDHCIYNKEEAEQDDFLRVSMHLYNNENDIDQFIEVLSGCLS
ncbi:MAG TPA: aminotransferase class V-fold PLP-dependent enzyme [Candidatus Obscuribacter sp.]|nr:aminotransferase class V-fold PLP-dependent enzyme [Candidatus Obscuribacter sp.]